MNMNFYNRSKDRNKIMRQFFGLPPRLAFLILLMFIGTAGLYARDNWQNTSHFFSATYDNEKCAVKIVVLRGDAEFGPAGENGYVENATIKYDETILAKITSTDVASNVTITPMSGLGKVTYENTQDGRYYYTTFYWYPNKKISSGTAKISGTWDVNGAYKTDGMNGEHSVIVPDLAVIKHTGTILNTANYQTEINFSSSSTQAFNGKGSYYLYRGNDKIKEINATASKTFIIDGISESSNEYFIRQEWKEPNGGYTYINDSERFTVNAYTFPRDLTATFNDQNRTLLLKWVMTAVGGENVERNDYEIQRWSKSSGKWTTLANLPYDQSMSTMTFEDDFFKENLVTDEYRYRVRRKDKYDTWRDEVAEEVSISITTEHMDLIAGTQNVKLENRKAIITWDVNNNTMWSSGSKFIISRYNLTSNSKEDIELNKEDLLKKTYTDQYINSCDKYYYSLQVKPGGYYVTIAPISTNSIIWTEIGDMVSMSASKGYYRNYVELNWTADFTGGSFDHFEIERKVNGESDDMYKLLGTVTSSVSVTDYVWKDENCIAGLVYDYRITGVLLCADEKMYSKNQPKSVGYISPKGEIYGRVTFESGQGIADVMMQLETNASLNGTSRKFGGTDNDYIETNNNLQQTNSNYTLQLMVAPSTSLSNGVLLKKGNLELGLNNGKPYFKAGTKNISSNESLEAGKFATLAAVYKEDESMGNDSIFLYVIKDKMSVVKSDIQRLSPENGKLVVGKGFKGNIDEVRIWDLAVDSSTLEEDYFRFLVGNENGLILYWGFDEPVDDEVYDSSYGNIRHNENHGKVFGNVLKDTESHPSLLKNSYLKTLSFCGKTDTSGNYRIAGIPYEGSGTEYTITPLFGVHQFTPTSKTLVIGESSSVFNVDFVDMSSFNVQGYVYYNNTNVPVKDVMFYIDGQVASKSNGEMITSGEDGSFSISVPVGVHEVKAGKANHVFVNNGKLVNSFGADLNYQDDMSNVRFWDSTTVKVIGKAVGGYKQYEYPTGLSLSKNNLGQEVYINMELKDFDSKTYHILSEKDSLLTVPHYFDKYNNTVVFSEGNVRIDMNNETGEFVANLLPEVYKITSIYATGYDNQIEDVAKELDLSNVFATNYIKTDIDSLANDSVAYNAEFSYKFEVTPVFDYIEVMDSVQMTEKAFFGTESESQTFFINGKNETVDIFFWDSKTKTYNFEKPVYKKGGWYYFKINTYYPFYYNNDKVNGKVDILPVQGGRVNFTNTIKSENVELEINENGECLYVFQASNIDVNGASGGLQSLQISVVGDGQPAGSPVKLEAYVLGSESRGSDFTTQGPNSLLYVLRDPPGSNSFASIEKGTTITHTRTDIENGFYQDGEFNLEHLLGIKISTSVGLGVATTTEVDSENTASAIIEHHEESEDRIKSVNEVTFQTKISTSDDPLYVGADGDVLIGYSTNMILSAADEITIKRKENLGLNDVKIKDFGDYVLCKATSLDIGQKFGTMFLYPQVHIEQVIIPQLENLISSYLRFDLTPEEAQTEADVTGKTVYVSKLSKDDPNFGLPNPGTILTENGEFYDIYFPSTITDDKKVDQIDSCYTSIKNWVRVLAENEEKKVNAIKLGQSDRVKNYSFQAGSSIEESYGFSTTSSTEYEYSFTAGSGLAGAIGFSINGFGMRFSAREVAGGHGGYSTEDETEKESVYSFTLAENGDYDYQSIDVINIADDTKKEADMVFRLRGGATSCPYEGEQYTKYYEPGMHKISEGSLRIENPYIEVEPAEVFNVPSNNPAVFELRMTNRSEAAANVWLTLRVVDESIPNGAKLSIDGVPLSDGRTFLVPADDYLVKTLEVSAGANAYDYENMKVVLSSQCQCDPTGFQEVISDTVSFSAHFIPTSTEVHIKSPGNNWTLNTECDTINGKYYLPITVYDYDINYRGFNRIEVQYKPVSESKQWSILRTFYKNQEDVTNPETEEWIDKNITMTANFFGEEDQNYDIRAVSYCEYSLGEGEPASEVTYESETISGVKDTKRPVLFGNPLPADGILDVDDEVMLNFSEDIADGYLTPSNFEVTAVKNGSQNDHSVSVRLNGDNDYITTEFEKNLSGKSLTAEMWVMPEDAGRAGTFFLHGQGDNVFEIGMDGQGCMKIRLGKNTYTSEPVEFKQGTWSHVMVSYNADENTLTAYKDFDTVVLNEVNVPLYEGIGVFQFGRDSEGGSHYKGSMHDFRLWDAAVSINKIKENSLKVLSGLESSLMLYYPMNEGRGNELTDKARGNTAVLNGSWNTPDGRAVNFTGDGYMVINSSEIPVREDQNFTLEFWFRTNSENVGNQTLMNNGLADGTDFMANAEDLFYIGFDNNNRLFFRKNKQTITMDGNYADMNWHHFAFTVNRNAENAQIYMDGNLNQYFNTDSIGGFENANIYVGAVRYYEDQAYKLANYFNGSVDEIRIWNSHMTQNDINRNANVQATGKELGLIAYYPFEKYITNTSNIKELVFTTEEMVEGKYSADLFNGASETTEKAPLKSKGTETSILHTFVVNEDALIITLIEPEDRIEKTIVNFAVQNVRDINGNKMDGVVRWSAYIDRNQLRWSEPEIRIEKDQYEAMEFEVDLNNVGGSTKSYTIEGLPAWLTAEPEYGEIAPKSTQHILFTINEGTNVGSYDEVIYAVGENGVTEPLNIQLKVNGIKPDWNVNPADYEYSMTVFGQMRFEGIFSADKEDMLAAFENGECIGVANSSYDKDQDMWYTFLSVYNNKQQSNTIEFRMWDASTGKTYSAVPDEPISFVSGSIVGTAKSPVIFDGKEILFQNMTLVSGWNWISFNLQNSALSDVNATLGNGKWSAGDQIKDNSGKAFASYSAKSEWVSDGLAFNNLTSYLLYTANNQTLSTSGSEVDATTTMIPVKAGRWNYISYLPLVNMTVKEALAGYDAMENDVIRSQNQFAMYTGKSWIGNLTYMESGKGYMLYRNSGNDTEFRYPAVQGSLSRSYKVAGKRNESFLNSNYAENMNIVATSMEAEPEDRILAYVNGELRGVSEYVMSGNEGFSFINVAGQETGDVVIFALERNGEIIAYANNTAGYSSKSVLGTTDAPFVIDFTEKKSNLTVYPTPFDKELNIQVTAENGEEIKVTVYNAAGQIVYFRYEVMPYNGTYVMTWDGNTNGGVNCDSGIYFVRIETDGEVKTCKVEKIN